MLHSVKKASFIPQIHDKIRIMLSPSKSVVHTVLFSWVRLFQSTLSVLPVGVGGGGGGGAANHAQFHL